MSMENENLSRKISELKQEKNGILLAHNYVIPEVQVEADYLGDSLGLARKSAEADADLVVFAGVDFMAETAAMLNPDKKVLIPDRNARCPMAGMLPVSDVIEAKKKHPDAAVVLYVNTLAEARAEADVTCTSANAVKVVNALDEDKVLFGPDRNLAWHVEQNTDKEIIRLPEGGHCYVHVEFSVDDVKSLSEKYPDAEVLVHPEADPEVQKLADYICSTSQMLSRAEKSSSKRYIIATEEGMVHRLRRDYPDKEFFPVLAQGICNEMKMHTLEKVYRSFKDEIYLVELPPKVAERAGRATKRMLKIS